MVTILKLLGYPFQYNDLDSVAGVGGGGRKKDEAAGRVVERLSREVFP